MCHNLKNGEKRQYHLLPKVSDLNNTLFFKQQYLFMHHTIYHKNYTSRKIKLIYIHMFIQDHHFLCTYPVIYVLIWKYRQTLKNLVTMAKQYCG